DSGISTLINFDVIVLNNFKITSDNFSNIIFDNSVIIILNIFNIAIDDFSNIVSNDSSSSIYNKSKHEVQSNDNSK
ncbi:8801_t:CDS:1, partial [Cetraspora pellucida]